MLPYLCTYTQRICEEVHGFCPVSAKYGILPNPPWYGNKLFKQMPAWEEGSEVESLGKVFKRKVTKLLGSCCLFGSFVQKCRHSG